MTGELPSAGREPPTLNPSQTRAVVATFRYVDGLLSDVERLARAELSMFATERGDVGPEERRLMLSFVADARGRMLAALDRLGIPRPQPTVSARWGIEITLKFAASALGELDATRLRGYGSMDPGIAVELQALTADLEAAATRAVALLHEHDAGGLLERLAAVRGPAGEILRALERLSAERGLSEVRSLIAAAAERAASSTFDIGVFGRVSAGKSSLINALAGTTVLPVGATPATAVPLRVRRGPLGAVVHMLDGARTTVAVTALARYATEEENPRNALGVRAVEITAPGVPDGVCFLDTPGVGSLATSGPAQAFAWLPRCDLGLVLVTAGGPVGADDVALVAGLAHAGIAYRVLLSKSDILEAGERERTIGYVRRELEAALGPGRAVEIQPVSALAAHSSQLETLRRSVLEPLATDHARTTREALRTRLHSLISATAAALDGRSAPPDDGMVARHEAALTAAARIRSEATHLAAAAPELLARTAEVVTDAWRRGEDGAPAARAALLMEAGAALDGVRGAVDEFRTAARAKDAPSVLPPLFDPDLLGALPDLAPSLPTRWLPRHALAARRLQHLAGPLQDAVERYASRLEAWGRARLDEAERGAATARVAHEGATDPLLADLRATAERV